MTSTLVMRGIPAPRSMPATASCGGHLWLPLLLPLLLPVKPAPFAVALLAEELALALALLAVAPALALALVLLLALAPVADELPPAGSPSS